MISELKYRNNASLSTPVLNDFDSGLKTSSYAEGLYTVDFSNIVPFDETIRPPRGRG